MNKKGKLILSVILWSLFLTSSYSYKNDIVLNIDYNTEVKTGHPCARPSVSYDDDEITIKSDSTIYDVNVVIRDQYGNIMHQSTQTISEEETTIYVPDLDASSVKTNIDLYYDREHLTGYFE